MLVYLEASSPLSNRRAEMPSLPFFLFPSFWGTCLTCLGPSLPALWARRVRRALPLPSSLTASHFAQESERPVSGIPAEEGGKMEVLVLADFEGQLGDELKITAGEIIRKVHPGPEEGWLQGELGGQVGLFPQQFVQEIPASLRSDGTQRFPRSLRSANAAKKKATAKQRWCRVVFPYVPTKEDELELSTGDLVQILEEIEDGWWLGKKRGQLGVFPSNFVQELSDPSLDTPFLEPKGGAAKQRPKMTNETFVHDESEKIEKPVTSPPEPETPKVRTPQEPPSSNDTPRYCRAMFDFEPEHEDELLLRKGDLILLLNKETVDLGWWEGESRGKKGLFPDNFVMPLTNLDPGIKSKVPTRKKEADKATKGAKKPCQGNKVEMRPFGDLLKDSKEQKKMETPKTSSFPAKKAAPPPPPVPAKAKPAPTAPQKYSNGPVSFPATPAVKAKAKGTETDTLDAVVTPGVKLTHPTANRPKMPGKRPPNQLVEKGPVHPSNPAENPQNPEQQSPHPMSEKTTNEESLTSVDDFKAELRTLRGLMDLMQTQHRKEIEELKAEMSREQAKREALQVDIEHLRQALAIPRRGGPDPKKLSPTLNLDLADPQGSPFTLDAFMIPTKD
ncbi:SH3 domain-containing protein 21 isoform X1 [Anolis carolinensis]|uniref:SH3 domain-containing protein 21 isoform X1 n=1 Tax=Anolis carolinensis TaxID=28377 RepID=UPI002F2B340C